MLARRFIQPACVSVVAVTLLTGCPQLLNDEFRNGTLDSQGGGTSQKEVSEVSGGTGGATAQVSNSTAEAGVGLPVADTAGTSQSTKCNNHEITAPEQVFLGLDDKSIWSPSLSADGLELFFSASIEDGTLRYESLNERIYVARRTSKTLPFSAAAEVSEIATDGADGSPFIDSSGLTLFFYSTRAGGVGGRDLYFAQRKNREQPFETPTPLTVLNTSSWQLLPWLTEDGLTLLYTGNTDDGYNSDIYIAKRAFRTENFGSGAPIPELKIRASADGPTLSRDGLSLYFASERDSLDATRDIYVAHRNQLSDQFEIPEKVTTLSGPGDDTDPKLSFDGKEIYFSSDRSGTQQVWRAVREECQ